MSHAYRTLLEGLAAELGIEAADLLATEELVVDGQSIGLVLDGEDEAADVVLFTGLGLPAPQRQADVYAVLLEANNFWIGTGGATLALNPATREVMLCARYPVPGTTPATLANVLDVFADAALFWQDFVAGAPLEAMPEMGREFGERA